MARSVAIVVLRAGFLASLLVALPARCEETTAPADSRTADAAEQLAATSFVARIDDVPVRAGPAFMYRVLARLHRGEGVVVDGRAGEWLRLAGAGWVLAGQLWTREEAARAGSRDPAARDGATPWTVAAASANIRSARTTDSPVVRRLATGDAASVLRVVDGWAELPDGWIRADLLRAPPRQSASIPAPQAGHAGPRHWSLLALSGVGIDVYELSDPTLLQRIREDLRATNATDVNWTILGVMVSVEAGAPGPFRWSPEVTTFVAVDASGEKYGSVFARGQLEHLPADLREALGPRDVAPGERFSGLLLFRPTLSAADIAELSVRIDGRVQPLVPAQ